MVPEAEIISAETQTEASQVSAEDPESSRITSPVASDVWRQRGEELAPAILDFESRPEPGWREWNEPVQSASAGEMPEQVSDIRLMPDIELVQARKAWLQPLLTQLRENYKTICQKRGTSCRGRGCCPAGGQFCASAFAPSCRPARRREGRAGSAFIQTSTNQSPAKANGSGRR